jgi:hypothetical protein
MLNFLKMASVGGCALALDFSQEKDFPQSNLFLRCARTLLELLSGAPLPAEGRYDAAPAWCDIHWSTQKIRKKLALRKSCSKELLRVKHLAFRNPRKKALQKSCSWKKYVQGWTETKFKINVIRKY